MNKRWRRLLVIITVGAVALILAARFGPDARQRRGLEAAGELNARVASTLAVDPRFAGVETHLTTHPALYVGGQVPDAKALADVQQLFQTPSEAEFRVIMKVTVADGAASRPGG